MSRPRGPWPALPPERADESCRLALARKVRRVAEAVPEWTYAQIGAAFGISRTWASELLCDPTGERAAERHERARGTCADCGGPTSWPGEDGAPKRCWPCERVRLGAEAAERHPCGTAPAYARGCRCARCRRAHADRMGAYQRERYATDPAWREAKLAAHRRWIASPAGQAYLASRRRRVAVPA